MPVTVHKILTHRKLKKLETKIFVNLERPGLDNLIISDSLITHLRRHNVEGVTKRENMILPEMLSLLFNDTMDIDTSDLDTSVEDDVM